MVASMVVHHGDVKNRASLHRHDATCRDPSICPCSTVCFLASTADHSGDPSHFAAMAARRVTLHARASTVVRSDHRDFAAKMVHDSMVHLFAARGGRYSRGAHLPKEVRHHLATNRMLDQAAVPAPHRRRPKRFQQRPTEVQID
jgi:hypothetical protein